MEQETMKCPYCGEEILAVAKKCKHCGEWLDEEEIEGEVVETEEEESDSADDDPNWDWLYKVIAWVVVLAVAFFTLPSEEKQTERMMEELRVLVRKDIKNQTQNQDVFTQALGQGMMKDKGIVDKLVHQRYVIKIDNYKVVSTITVKDKETGETRTCGFAGFGIVYIKK
jgi:hypothetical protein